MIATAQATARILIAGGPRCGKTTLAEDLARAAGIQAEHSDDLIGVLDWSSASLEVSRWIDRTGPWIVEGVAVVRALRKLLERSSGKPAEFVYWSLSPKAPTTKAQDAMGKGCATAWEPVREELQRRGVSIRYF